MPPSPPGGGGGFINELNHNQLHAEESQEMSPCIKMAQVEEESLDYPDLDIPIHKIISMNRMCKHLNSAIDCVETRIEYLDEIRIDEVQQIGMVCVFSCSNNSLTLAIYLTNSISNSTVTL